MAKYVSHVTAFGVFVRPSVHLFVCLLACSLQFMSIFIITYNSPGLYFHSCIKSLHCVQCSYAVAWAWDRAAARSHQHNKLTWFTHFVLCHNCGFALNLTLVALTLCQEIHSVSSFCRCRRMNAREREHELTDLRETEVTVHYQYDKYHIILTRAHTHKTALQNMHTNGIGNEW